MLLIGVGIGLENLQAPGTINIPIMLFFFGCNPPGFHHSMDDLQEEGEQTYQILGQFIEESMEEADTLPKLCLVTPIQKLVPLLGSQL